MMEDTDTGVDVKLNHWIKSQLECFHVVTMTGKSHPSVMLSRVMLFILEEVISFQQSSM